MAKVIKPARSSFFDAVKPEITESKSITSQPTKHMARRIGSNHISVTPSQWAAMWPSSMPTRSTFGSQVVQYNSMGRPMRINLSKQKSIRISHSNNYPNQQQSAKVNQLRSNQPKVTPDTPSKKLQASAASNSSYMTNTGRRTKQTAGRQQSNLIQVPLQENTSNACFSSKNTSSKNNAPMSSAKSHGQERTNYNTEYPPLQPKLGSNINEQSHDLAYEVWPSLKEAQEISMQNVKGTPWGRHLSHNKSKPTAHRNFNMNCNNNSNIPEIDAFQNRQVGEDSSSNNVFMEHKNSDDGQFYNVLINSFMDEYKFFKSQETFFSI